MAIHSELVDQQVAAYNQGDIEKFVSTYASNAIVTRHDGSAVVSGQNEIQAHHCKLFEQSPKLHVEIRNRIEVGSFVIDEEYVTGFTLDGQTSQLQAAVAYRIENDLIAEARLYL
jgi:uncharacterized protein (TIGR02246 family)